MNTLKTLIANGSEFITIEQVVLAISCDPHVAFEGLVELWNRQTIDEKCELGTKHKNRYGFSKKHVTRGSELALAYKAGKDLSVQDMNDATSIAHAYRNQLWMVAMGDVPVNNLYLGQ